MTWFAAANRRCWDSVRIAHLPGGGGWDAEATRRAQTKRVPLASATLVLASAPKRMFC
jgi:hypothetical protein